MNDQESVRDTIASVAHHVDAKDWSSLQRLFAAAVDVDYTSLFGGTPEKKDATELVGGWRDSLDGVSTQHLLGPIVVTVSGDVATAACHVRAWHLAEGREGGDEWVVAGHYLFALRRTAHTWEVERMTLQTLHQTGNRTLLKEA